MLVTAKEGIFFLHSVVSLGQERSYPDFGYKLFTYFLFSGNPVKSLLNTLLLMYLSYILHFMTYVKIFLWILIPVGNIQSIRQTPLTDKLEGGFIFCVNWGHITTCPSTQLQCFQHTSANPI